MHDFIIKLVVIARHILFIVTQLSAGYIIENVIIKIRFLFAEENKRFSFQHHFHFESFFNTFQQS